MGRLRLGSGEGNRIIKSEAALLRRCRWAIALFIAGLILSGLTAFPLAWELDLLARWISPGGIFHALAPAGLQHWILPVRDGLAETYARYPWIAYSTDWLAFGHLVIALFFLPVWRDPIRHVAILRVGLWACALVIPLALIAGPIRGIPFYWRLLSCDQSRQLPPTCVCRQERTRIFRKVPR